MRTKTLIALTLTFFGALLLAAPMLTDFVLTMCNRAANVSADDRTVCQIGGGILLFMGLVFNIFAFRAAENTVITRADDRRAP